MLPKCSKNIQRPGIGIGMGKKSEKSRFFFKNKKIQEKNLKKYIEIFDKKQRGEK